MRRCILSLALAVAALAGPFLAAPADAGDVPAGLDGFKAVRDQTTGRTVYYLGLEDGSEYWYKPPTGLAVERAPLVVRARTEAELVGAVADAIPYSATHGVERDPKRSVEGWTGTESDLKQLAEGEGQCPSGPDAGGWLTPKVGLDDGTAELLTYGAAVALFLALVFAFRNKK